MKMKRFVGILTAAALSLGAMQCVPMMMNESALICQADSVPTISEDVLISCEPNCGKTKPYNSDVEQTYTFIQGKYFTYNIFEDHAEIEGMTSKVHQLDDGTNILVNVRYPETVYDESRKKNIPITAISGSCGSDYVRSIYLPDSYEYTNNIGGADLEIIYSLGSIK